MTIVDRITNELLYERVQTFPGTRYIPAEYAHYCFECGVEDGNEHGEDCKLAIVEEFLNKNGYTIERWVRND